MSKRTKFLLGIGVIAALLIGWQVTAFAVHDLDVFELEGDAFDDPAIDGDDWDTATAAKFEPEPDLNDTIFTGGGSKDPQDITKWAWKNDAGGLPDKDNLLDGFAVRYTDDTSGDELLYFGADRYDNSGDAHMGFWFLQDEVGLGTNNIGGGTGFTGAHTDGDVLVVTNFSNGGGTSTITVYEWDADCNKAGQLVDHDEDPTTANKTCGDDNLVILATSSDALCAEDLSGDSFCGIVNAETIELPWSFTDKSGTTFDHDDDPTTDPVPGALNGEFFEGGLNLTDLGLDEECFSTFAVETRSSTSTTATLKDFILGEFEVCEADMTTQASTNGTVVPGQTAVTDLATITVTGAASPDDPTGFVKFFLCGPSATGACTSSTSGGTQVGTPLDGETVGNQPNGTTTDGIAIATSEAVNTQANPLAPGKYCFRAEYSGDDNYDPDSHTDTTAECFTVSQPTTVSTVQRWIPQDTATVTPANAVGTVSFQLYSSLNCAAGTELGQPITDSTKNADGKYETNNTTIIDDTTVSWKASFDSSNFEDSVGVCETANVTFDNDGP